jgi:pentatricopeptide repeat protein
MNIDKAIAGSMVPVALRVCGEMKQAGVRPDATTYHHILRGLAEAGMYTESAAVLEDMERMGIKPDQLAYHYVMQASRRCRSVRTSPG